MMNFRSHPRQRSAARLSQLTCGAWGTGGFTLLEVLLAVVIFSLVLASAHLVFATALRLRNRTVESVEASVPMEQALAILRRDLQSLVPPGGLLAGPLQSLPTNRTLIGQSGPYFYTSAAQITDFIPWGDRQRVAYRLVAPSNNTEGLDLVRSVARNLLPIVEDEVEDQFLMSGVEQLTFQFYDGAQWRNDWDSTVETNVLPVAIKAQLLVTRARTDRSSRDPIELIVPIDLRPATNSTSTATNSSSGGGA